MKSVSWLASKSHTSTMLLRSCLRYNRHRVIAAEDNEKLFSSFPIVKVKLLIKKNRAWSHRSCSMSSRRSEATRSSASASWERRASSYGIR